MPKRSLNVYLHRHLVGELHQDPHGFLSFRYTREWVQNPKAVALSQSLPLRLKPFDKRECPGFFGGLLPDYEKRKKIARLLKISFKNDFAMLSQIGGECAGAVSFLAKGQALPDVGSSYLPLSNQKLGQLIHELRLRPLMAGYEGVRLSLAGAQDKLAVQFQNKKIALPLGLAPSTHILKPVPTDFKDIIFNEAFCMQLAALLKIPTAPVFLKKAEGIDYLLIKRYDRVVDESGALTRLHQEDFCQALGVVAEKKCQNEGGPSLKQCFDLLRKVSSVPAIDLQNLLDGVLFNFIIGNNDAHGKNFSLLYTPNQTRLAPFYDLISTRFYPELSPKMAMKIGSQYDPKKVVHRHFEKLASDSGLNAKLVINRFLEMASLISKNIDLVKMRHPISTKLKKHILKNCDSVLDNFESV